MLAATATAKCKKMISRQRILQWPKKQISLKEKSYEFQRKDCNEYEYVIFSVSHSSVI